MNERPIALITGASRKISIGAAIARRLARSGWDIALTYWLPYDREMPWGSREEELRELTGELEEAGARVFTREGDLSDPAEPARLIGEVRSAMGGLSALILSHCYSVDSDIQSTSLESFDRHFAVNARASWLLIREFSHLFDAPFGTGRIIALTSDHTAGNLPYGASKGALDRIVIAAAEENRRRGITANAVNPGATDSGWMDGPLKDYIRESTFLDRLGRPEDAASLVNFLCSPEGGWINGRLLFSDGGVKYS